MHEHAPSSRVADGTAAVRLIVDDAIARGTRVSFSYLNASGSASERTIRPREYCNWSNCIRGYCVLREEDRVFNISRMRDVHPADETNDDTIVPLFGHQIEIRQRLAEHDRFLVLAEMGTGKTLPVLLHISDLLLRGAIEDALVVAPLSALAAWRRDIELLSSERKKLAERAVRFVNYDRISRQQGRGQEEYWRRWGCIVLDEGHAISNPESNRTQFFVGRGKALGLVSKADYFYLLTGTLVANSRMRDSWAPLRAVLGDAWMPYRDFRLKYLSRACDEDVMEELLRLIAQHSYRVRKVDCLDLPEIMPDEVIRVPLSGQMNPVPLEKTTRELYLDAVHSYRESFAERGDSPFARFMLLRQIAAGFMTLEDDQDIDAKRKPVQLAGNKIRYALELIEANLPHKTVVFHEFIASGRALGRDLEAAGISFVSLNGAQSDKGIWRRFQSEPELPVAIVQYKSGSSGIDLFSASTTIYLEPPLSSTILSQSRGRTHRAGQNRSCSYFFLLSEETVEEAIYERVRCGEDFSEVAFREIMSRQFIDS